MLNNQRQRRIATIVGLLIALISNACILVGSIDETFSVSADVPADLPIEQAAHIGGVAVSVAVRGHYAYLGLSHEVIVLDMMDRTQPRAIEHVLIPATAIELVDQHAYIVGRDGLAILEITNPASPRVLGRWQAKNTLTDVVVLSDVAYAISYGNLYVFDVQDPSAPQLIAHHQFPVWFEGIVAAHGYIYAVSHDGMHTLDVTTPTQPVEVAFVETEEIPNGSISIQTYSMQTYAYFGGGHLIQRVDVSSPTEPVRAASIPVTDWVSNVVVVDDIVYLAAGTSGLELWRVDDESAPVRLGSSNTLGLATALTVVEGYVYLIDCDEGLDIFDVSDPAHIHSVGAYKTLGATYKVAATGSMSYVASGFNGGLHIVEIDDTTTHSTITTHLHKYNVHDVELAADRLYLIQDGLLKVYDVTTAVTPMPLGTYHLSGENSLTVHGDLAYLSNQRGDVVVLDIVEPTEIKIVKRYQALGYVDAMAVVQDYAYIPHQNGGLRIFRGANIGILNQVGHYAVEESINKIAIHDGYAYLALGTQGLRVVDISNPTQPRWVRNLSTADIASDIAIRDTFAIVAANSAGIQVFDIADPRAATVVAHYPTLDHTTSLVATERYLYVADRFGGVLVYAMADVIPTLPADYAFLDVNVITMAGEEMLSHQMVLIADLLDEITGE